MSHPLRQRLRFESISVATQPDGRCRMEVALEWCEQEHRGSAEGLDTHQGRIRAAAEAALAAALDAAGKRVELQMVGIKAVRAFDGWVVVSRLNGLREGARYPLLGAASCEAEEDLPSTAARALLDATNRILEPRAGRT
ncbi:MAG: hypothetical protein ACE5GJ_11700 [Gemmatimonadota bacterium]